MRIAVAGGTGLVGRQVVEVLSKAGHTTEVLARAHGVDLVSGDGLPAAMTGVEAVIDVSNVTTTRRSKAVAFFDASTRNLLAAGRTYGVRHHVVLSIVGIDRVKFGYYEGKLHQEQVALQGPVPATVLRATQFHEFAGQLLRRVRGPVALVPRQLIRPVAAAEVAAELALAAVGGAQGRAPDFAGPQDEDLVDMARRTLRARDERRAVVGVRLPGRSGRAMAQGGLRPGGNARYGRQTFEQWLAASAQGVE